MLKKRKERGGCGGYLKATRAIYLTNSTDIAGAIAQVPLPQCKGHQACVPAPLPFPLQSRRFRIHLSPYHLPLHIDGEVPSPKSTTSKPSESLRSCNGRDRTPAHLRIGYSPCRIQRVDRLWWRSLSVSSEWGGWGCWRYGPGSERSSLVFSSASSEAAEEEEGEEDAEEVS